MSNEHLRKKEKIKSQDKDILGQGMKKNTPSIVPDCVTNCYRETRRTFTTTKFALPLTISPLERLLLIEFNSRRLGAPIFGKMKVSHCVAREIIVLS